jgi:chromosome segregation ATPase
MKEQELFNVFESGGFSLRSNSQFQIIQQGQVQDLVAKGESGGFLNILKEVAGTVKFDDKMEKMQVSLKEAKEKKNTLDSTLGEILTKLEGLQIDKEAYREIEAVDMQKKAYQRMLYVNKIDAQNR